MLMIARHVSTVMSSTALCILALFCIPLLKVGAEYQLEAYLSSYSNPDHQQAEGRCCDGGGSSGCSNDCDNLFLFCLREAGHSQDDESCPLGMMSTRDALEDQEVFRFGDDIDRRVTNPLAFTGESAWPGAFQLYIRVRDSDAGNNRELVDMIYIDENLQVKPNFTSVMSYSGVHDNSRIEFSFRVRCLENYYGPDCTVRCVPRNNLEGYFTCNSAGEIVCSSGYTNVSTNCTTCVPAEGCMPNGFCTSPGECICLEGFTGSLCEIDLDPCGSRMPCQNGGNCSNAGGGGYTCSCSVGYNGQNCEEVTLVGGGCTGAACQNGGTCTSAGLEDQFQCQCLPGFQGLLCESQDNDAGNSKPDTSSGRVGGAVAGALLGVLLIVAGVIVGIVLWKMSSRRGSYGVGHTAKTDAKDAAHTIENPIYDNVEIGLAGPPSLDNSYSHSSQTNPSVTASTEYLLANPLYKQPIEDHSPPPPYAATINPYGEYGDNTLTRAASQNTLNEDSADFALPSFDDA